MSQNWFESSFWKRWNYNQLWGKSVSGCLPSWDINGAFAKAAEKQKSIHVSASLNCC